MEACVEAVIRYNGKTAGRDKFYRLVQYASKLVADILRKREVDQETINKVDSLINVVGMARVTYRLGMSLDLIQAAFKSFQTADTFILRTIIVLARFCTAGFLFYDMLAWPIKAKIIKADLAIVSLKSTTFWFWSAIFNLLRDFYEFTRELKVQLTEDNTPIILEHRKEKITFDFLKNICDMVIAGEACKKIPVSQSVVGFCGVISSMVYMMEIINPAMKL